MQAHDSVEAAEAETDRGLAAAIDRNHCPPSSESAVLAFGTSREFPRDASEPL
jgi:hypothetical protein